MDELTLEDAFDELSSAEDFLEFFEVDFEAPVVHVNRLHIMQRFHDYIKRAGEDSFPEDEAASKAQYKLLLEKAYQDFVESDAVTEKVFKVFRMSEPDKAFVSLDQIVKN